MEIKINLITPPDKVNTHGYNLFLIYPSHGLLTEIQNRFLASYEQDVNLYLYNCEEEQIDIDWMLDIARFADTTIIDVDNVRHPERELISFFLANPRTYWLTNALDPVYTSINKNRIINLETLAEIGGKFV